MPPPRHWPAPRDAAPRAPAPGALGERGPGTGHGSGESDDRGTGTMRAAVPGEYGKPLSVEGVLRPIVGPGQILTRLEACGACHTDVHIWPGEVSDALAVLDKEEVKGRFVIDFRK